MPKHTDVQIHAQVLEIGYEEEILMPRCIYQLYVSFNEHAC